MDVPEVRERWSEIKAVLKAQGHPAMAISALARDGTRDLLYRAAQMLGDLSEETPTREELLPVFRLEDDEEMFTVEWEEDGWRVRGERVERLAAMTIWNLDEAVHRFQRTLDRMEISDALEQAGVQPGDTAGEVRSDVGRFDQFRLRRQFRGEQRIGKSLPQPLDRAAVGVALQLRHVDIECRRELQEHLDR